MTDVYGLRAWAADGTTLTFDSVQMMAGVCIGIFKYNAGDTDTKTFPDLAGKTVTLRNIYGSTRASFPTGVNVDYALGYPRFNVSGVSFTIIVSLWVE